jgi:hypothetical protein
MESPYALMAVESLLPMGRNSYAELLRADLHTDLPQYYTAPQQSS